MIFVISLDDLFDKDVSWLLSFYALTNVIIKCGHWFLVLAHYHISKMKITIQTPNSTSQSQVTAFIRECLAKMEKLHSIIEAQVSLRSVQDTAGQNCLCEIKLVIPGNDLFASRREESFEIAAHATIDALKHQIDQLRTNWDKQRTASFWSPTFKQQVLK